VSHKRGTAQNSIRPDMTDMTIIV